MVSLISTLIVVLFGFIFMAMAVYITVIGRIGLQFFKYNAPFFKRRGTFYLIRQKNGHFKWIYGRFRTIWEWADHTKTYIRNKYDRMAQTAEPLIFLVEGFPINPLLFEQLPDKEMSRFQNNIIETSFSTGKLSEQIKDEKKWTDNLIPVATFAAIVIVLLVILMVFGAISNLTTLLEQLKPLVEQIARNPPPTTL